MLGQWVFHLEKNEIGCFLHSPILLILDQITCRWIKYLNVLLDFIGLYCGDKNPRSRWLKHQIALPGSHHILVAAHWALWLWSRCLLIPGPVLTRLPIWDMLFLQYQEKRPGCITWSLLKLLCGLSVCHVHCSPLAKSVPGSSVGQTLHLQRGAASPSQGDRRDSLCEELYPEGRDSWEQ